jgi:hypothetical protein
MPIVRHWLPSWKRLEWQGDPDGRTLSTLRCMEQTPPPPYVFSSSVPVDRLRPTDQHFTAGRTVLRTAQAQSRLSSYLAAGNDRPKTTSIGIDRGWPHHSHALHKALTGKIPSFFIPQIPVNPRYFSGALSRLITYRRLHYAVHRPAGTVPDACDSRHHCPLSLMPVFPRLSAT